MFAVDDFLPAEQYARITDVRVKHPGRSLELAQQRRRRHCLTAHGRLNIVAADHPARGVTKVGSNPLAMADRRGYLARIARTLIAEDVDGVMGTMDILEELLLLDGLRREAGAEALLDDKLMIVSLNRGGLAGTVWELDDPITGPRPAICGPWRFDGTKLLLRVCHDDSSSLKTLLACSEAITEANALGIPTFLEPLFVLRTANGYQVSKDSQQIAGLCGISSALGDSSRLLWLKLPYSPGYEVVAQSTTLPILMLGGEATGNPRTFLDEAASGMAAGSNVRGLLVGRNVLFPGDADPLTMAAAAGGLVHRRWTVDQAADYLQK